MFVFVYLPVYAAFICAAVGAVALIAAILLRFPEKKRVIIAGTGLLAGLLWCTVYDNVLLSVPRGLDGAETDITATVMSYPSPRTYGDIVSVSALTDAGRVSAELYIPGGCELRPGDEIKASVRFAYERGNLSARAISTVEVTGYRASIRHAPAELARAVSDSTDRVFGDEHAPFMRAIILGDTRDLRRDGVTYDALGYTGLAHIVSVSGMHVSFLVAAIAAVVKNRRALAFIGLPVTIALMAVTGFNAPVCRAVIMQSLTLTAPLFSRRADGVTSVSAALIILLAADPYSAAGIGFQLSFLSTLGIVMFAGRIDAAATDALQRRKFYANAVLRRITRAVVTSVAVTAGALTLTMPLIAYYFGYVSVIAPVANMAVMWAASFAFCGGLIAAICGILLPEVIGVSAAAVAALPAAWIVFAARTVSRAPFAAVYVSNPYILIWLAYIYAALAVFFATRGKLRNIVYPLGGGACILCLALLLTAASAGGGFEFAALDVGQGQCVVVSDGAHTAVIDCGSLNTDAARCADEFLQSRGATAIDLLLLTHFHTDHVSGAARMLDLYRVGALVIPRALPDGHPEDLRAAEEIIRLAEQRGTDIIYVEEPMEFRFGQTRITALPPPLNAPGDENQNCIVFLVTRGEWDALITGDMDYYGELALTEIYILPRVELLVAGHHGSRFSTSETLLDAVRPETVIISVGDNTFGHPAPQMLERLYSRGIRVYRTDETGNIRMRVD